MVLTTSEASSSVEGRFGVVEEEEGISSDLRQEVKEVWRGLEEVRGRGRDGKDKWKLVSWE